MQLVDLGQTSFGAVFLMEKMYISSNFVVSYVICSKQDLIYYYYFFSILIIASLYLGSQVYDQLGNVVCHGKASVIKEGHKSFPSGHTSCMWYFLYV